MTKDICFRYFPSRSRIVRRSFSRSSNARERRASAKETSKHCLKRWNGSKRQEATCRNEEEIMPFYQKLGEIPRKHHIWFHRNGAAPTYKDEGIAYEHVFTTEGFNEAYSICYHLRPPTRVRNVELIKHWEPKKVTDSPLRHHHLKTANIPRRGDLYTSRIPMLFNQDMTAYRAKPAKAYDKFEFYKNGGADEIIFVFKGGGVVETVFGKLPYRAEDYIVIPRGITYRIVPNKVEGEDYLILESAGPVRIPHRYLNHQRPIKMGAPYSERDFHAPSELLTIDKE